MPSNDGVTVGMIVAPIDLALAVPTVGDHRSSLHCAEVDTSGEVRPVLVFKGLVRSPIVPIEHGNGSVVREASVPLADSHFRQLSVRLSMCRQRSTWYFRQLTERVSPSLPPSDSCLRSLMPILVLEWHRLVSIKA